MRFVAITVAAAFVLVACSKGPAKQAEAPVQAAAPTQPTASIRHADPLPPTAPPALSTPETGNPEAPKAVVSSRPPVKTSFTQQEMKELERNPGATPALATTTVAPDKKHKSLQGKPGPSPAAGPDTAPVKVYIFSDFQCPVCKRVVEPIKALARTMPDKVQVIFKQNALEMHANAAGAAAASMAAFRQGKFWEYHDKLFQNQRNLNVEDLLVYAEEMKLDMERFKKDMKDPDIQAQIAYERDLADSLGVRGTPGFYVNGKKMVGWGSFGGYKAMVMRALRSAEGVAATTKVKPEHVAREATRKRGDDGKKFAELVWGAK